MSGIKKGRISSIALQGQNQSGFNITPSRTLFSSHLRRGSMGLWDSLYWGNLLYSHPGPETPPLNPHQTSFSSSVTYIFTASPHSHKQLHEGSHDEWAESQQDLCCVCACVCSCRGSLHAHASVCVLVREWWPQLPEWSQWDSLQRQTGPPLKHWPVCVHVLTSPPLKWRLRITLTGTE